MQPANETAYAYRSNGLLNLVDSSAAVGYELPSPETSLLVTITTCSNTRLTGSS